MFTTVGVFDKRKNFTVKAGKYSTRVWDMVRWAWEKHVMIWGAIRIMMYRYMAVVINVMRLYFVFI